MSARGKRAGEVPIDNPRLAPGENAHQHHDGILGATIASVTLDTDPAKMVSAVFGGVASVPSC
jgi:hypothetical protein